MKIYVGNLTEQTGSPELRELFEPHGEVHSARVARSRATDERRGYAIVEMDEDDGRAAIAALSGMNIDGRVLRVKEARGGDPGSGGALD